MEEPTRAADKQSTIRKASTISPIFTKIGKDQRKVNSQK